MAGHRDDGSYHEDKAHHPNRRVGRSDLPRLSSALAGVMNESIDRIKQDPDMYGEDGPEELSMHHSMAGYLPRSLYYHGISELDAATALREYRKDRDAGRYVDDAQEDIRDAYKDRQYYS